MIGYLFCNMAVSDWLGEKVFRVGWDSLASLTLDLAAFFSLKQVGDFSILLEKELKPIAMSSLKS